MRFEKFSFGSIRIDGSTYDHDVVIDRGEVHKRKKKLSPSYMHHASQFLVIAEVNRPDAPHQFLDVWEEEWSVRDKRLSTKLSPGSKRNGPSAY